MQSLQIINVSKQYAHHKALDSVSLAVPKGSVYGLLGPNGAGKTSLIRIITQITGADEGEVLFNGEKLNPSHIYRMGYLPEERGLYKKMEVGEQLLFFARLKGLSRADAMHKLKDWVERFEIKNWWTKKVEELSKGMQQKVQFIATVLHQPELIILDEPFTGFDPINANLIRDEIIRLNKEGSTFIFSTHRMETVEQLCDHIALINKSKVVLEGEVKQIKNQFRTQTYEVEHSICKLQLSSSFVLQKSTPADGNMALSEIKILHGTPNDLLKELMPVSHIHSLKEIVPDMNDIFIQAVNKNVTTPSAVTL
ncbi:MAG: ATP-binding cassette domain-containing protein [Bacteroidia bacterium]|nr:ATP-binding cassette domain-containing protein [Bacteroidia bacterium]